MCVPLDGRVEHPLQPPTRRQHRDAVLQERAVPQLVVAEGRGDGRVELDPDVPRHRASRVLDDEVEDVTRRAAGLDVHDHEGLGLVFAEPPRLADLKVGNDCCHHRHERGEHGSERRPLLGVPTGQQIH